MIRDFYIRYSARNFVILQLYKYGKLRLTLYSRNTPLVNKFVIVKNRNILFETSNYFDAIKYFRNEVFMVMPEPRDLFNN